MSKGFFSCTIYAENQIFNLIIRRDAFTKEE